MNAPRADRTDRGVAIVTGCSSGFGLLTAVELARFGFRVYATMRDLAKQGPLEEATAGAGKSVATLRLDVTDDDSVDAAVAEVLEQERRIDVVVNNAGYGIGGFVEELAVAELAEQFETNFFGAVRVTKAVLPSMRERGSGRIIMVSSLNGRLAVPGLSAYCASKFALEGFAESLRCEALLDGIHVSVVEPGTYRTEIFSTNRRVAARSSGPASQHLRAETRLEQYVMRRVERSTQDPVDVAKAIARIATSSHPRLRYVVGTDARAALIAMRVLPGRVLERNFLRILRGRPGTKEANK